MTLQRTLARSLVTVRTWPFFIDMGVGACGLAIFFAVVGTGRYWLGKPAPIAEISHSISALPLYAFYSITRIGIAYLLSLVFAIGYGYIAAYNPRLDPW
ncbi:MAG: ABC transporter permease, partial [Terracidiphilus sp.]